VTLRDLVERLQSLPAYQQGHADSTVYVDGLFPIAVRQLTDVQTYAVDGQYYIVLVPTGLRPGPDLLSRMLEGSGLMAHVAGADADTSVS
jgi:hypothetical protein